MEFEDQTRHYAKQSIKIFI